MYTVTFYSFKGGTGRSMALANVAIELARRGRCVLLVDFDLEAPGLDTFRLSEGKRSSPGLVSYIHQYLQTAAPPDVRNYVYECRLPSEIPGRVLLMPAGEQDDSYDDEFRAIDWQDLYLHRDGFLLFENLKAQWESRFKPDYVLIDSRTGHTDIGGICTRQLPDAVVVFFFPNEQNRRGLESIVDQIREEATGPLAKAINLHFVMGNVPDLDDEEEILAANLQKISDSLGFHEPTAVIHHYNSLSLLNQAIFTLERPKSRLAEEYRQLTSAIVRANLEDEEGALEFLDETLRMVRTRSLHNPSKVEDSLEEIRTKHPRNGEVLRRLARVRIRQAKSQEALALLSSAVEQGFVDSDILLARAQLNVSGNPMAARLDLERLLQLEQVPSVDLSVALRLLRRVAPEGLMALLSRATAIKNADFDLELVRELESSADTLEVAEMLLRRWRSEQEDETIREDIRNELVLCLIGQGDFDHAKQEASKGRTNPEEFDIYDAYNYSMAEWGLTGQLPIQFLKRVVFLNSKRQQPSSNANSLQCLSVAAWALGDVSGALTYLSRAATRVNSAGSSIFSTWSYLTVPPDQFLKEVAEMMKMFKGGNVLPHFITRAAARRAGNVAQRTN